MATPVLVVSAGSLDSSVHIPTDVFLGFFDDPFPDPATPHAAHYYEVVGAALAASAAQLALGGYTVVLDGPMFLGGAAGMAEICGRRGVRVHYAVLRADLATCVERAARRDPAEPRDLDKFTALHARFVDLGESETNAIDASGTVEDVAASVLSTFRSGRLALKPRSSANQGRST